MNKKRILALMMGAIIASSGISQMAVQVYADDGESTRISKSMEDASDAEPLTKLTSLKSERANWLHNNVWLKLNLSNLYVSESGLIFEPMENMEAKLVCFDAGKMPRIKKILDVGDILDDEETFDGDITVPQNVKIGGETYKVTSIGDSAFRKCYFLENVILPASLNKIGKYAFKDCENLSLISLPENLRYIGKKAFMGCLSLQLKELPANLCGIGEKAFKGAAIEDITIPWRVDFLGRDAFDTHTIGEITLEKGSSLKGIDIVHAYGCQFTLSDPSMLKLIEEESTEEESTEEESIEEVEEIEEEEEGSSSEWEPEAGLIVSDEPSSYEWDY